MALPSRSVIMKSATQAWPTGRVRARGRSGSIVRRIRSSSQYRQVTPSLLVGLTISGLLLLTALLAPLLAPYPPDLIQPSASLQAPSLAHPFGTDLLGRDLLSRVLYGARIAVGMAVAGVAISASLGILLGPSLRNTVIALGVVGVPSFYRLMRSCTLSARQGCYVEAAEAIGAGDGRIMLHHILPNVASGLIVLATMRLGILILAGGGLSFIGLGAQPPQPEWGALLATGREYMDMAPWLAVFPGICITVTVAGFNLLGDGLRDAWDPRRASNLN